MSTPSIKVGQGNWGIKANNLLGYANTDKKFVAREFTVGRLLNTATRVNASGNIEGVNANVPRIDYFGGQASLLVEPSAQNFHPEGDSMVSFQKFAGGGAVMPSVTSTTSLSGQNNAAIIVGGSGSTGNWGIFRLIPTGINSGQTVTYSVFAKAGTNNFMQLLQSNVAGTGGNNAYFDLSNGTTPTANARIENWGNGWYRCIMPPFTFTATPDGTYNIGHRLTENTTSNTWSTPYLGKSVIFYGAQLEIGSVATSYIPTLSTVPVTRNADVISVTGVAGLIGQTEGTIYVEVDVRNFTNSARIIAISDGTGFNAIPLQLLVDGGLNFIRVPINALSSSQTDIIASMSSGVNKIALGYAQNNVALYLNGTSVGTDTSCNIPATNKLDLGSLNGATFFNNRIRAASIYQTRLPNTTTDGSPSLQSITTL
jgi:hypothetical protein